MCVYMCIHIHLRRVLLHKLLPRARHGAAAVSALPHYVLNRCWDAATQI